MVYSIIQHPPTATHVLDILYSNGNDIETKSERSFDFDFVFDIEAKRTCLFQNL
jgi:hypothetical protein